MRAAVLLLAFTLAGCSGGPTRHKAVVKSHTGNVTWWGPTQAVADARARWYKDPSWRTPQSICLLGYK